jgi:hypothetical protein
LLARGSSPDKCFGGVGIGSRKIEKIKIVDDLCGDRDDARMTDLCEYCELHGAERNGYCSDVCRRSMELLRAAEKLVEQVERGRAAPVRRLASAVDALR